MAYLKQVSGTVSGSRWKNHCTVSLYCSKNYLSLLGGDCQIPSFSVTLKPLIAFPVTWPEDLAGLRPSSHLLSHCPRHIKLVTADGKAVTLPSSFISLMFLQY